MPVKIRLTRMGKKKQPTYRVVVVDSRKPRDGAYIEQIGRYDPRQEPSLVEIDNGAALKWLERGAQPTERARKLLEISGAWGQFRVSKGDIHTVPQAAAPAAVVTEVEQEIHVVGEDDSADSDDSPDSVDSVDSADTPDAEEVGEASAAASADTEDEE